MSSLSPSSYSYSSSVSSSSSGFFSGKESDSDLGESGTFGSPIPLPWFDKTFDVSVMSGFELKPNLNKNESGSGSETESNGSDSVARTPASQSLAIQIPTQGKGRSVDQEKRPKAAAAANNAKPAQPNRKSLPKHLTMEQLLHPGITANDLGPLDLLMAQNLIRCYDLGIAMMGLGNKRDDSNENENGMDQPERETNSGSGTPDSALGDVFAFSPSPTHD